VLQPELWDILDSSDEEDQPGGDAGAAGAAAPSALPARYELNEDGEYKTAADMRAAYNQLRCACTPRLACGCFSHCWLRTAARPLWHELKSTVPRCGLLPNRHVLEHPDDFMRPPKPRKQPSATTASQVRNAPPRNSPKRVPGLTPRSFVAAARV
jgi:hypothetical protein